MMRIMRGLVRSVIGFASVYAENDTEAAARSSTPHPSTRPADAHDARREGDENQ